MESNRRQIESGESLGHHPLTDLDKIKFLHVPIQLEKGHDMAEGLLEVSDDNFESSVMQSQKPVLVDFWAPWCGPCKAIAPLIEDLAQSYGGKIIFAKCNVDDNPLTPGKYGIKAIPTLIFFKQGQVAEQITGIVSKTRLEEVLNGLV